MLCDKFVEDELTNTTISNLVGGKMKIIEDYAQRKVDETKKQIIIKLDKKGFETEEIAETADVSIDFVNEVLAQ